MTKRMLLALCVIALAGTGAWASTEAAADGATAPTLVPASRVTPSFPPSAFRARTDGTVLVEAQVLADGSVGEIEIVEVDRPRLGFEKAAVDAVRQWEFQPAALKGEAVESTTLIRVSFRSPRANQGGYVAAEFDDRGSTTPFNRIGTRASARLPGSSYHGGDNGNTTAVSDDQASRVASYGKPPACLGCLYDRNSLIPPQTYGLAQVGGPNPPK